MKRDDVFRLGGCSGAVLKYCVDLLKLHGLSSLICVNYVDLSLASSTPLVCVTSLNKDNM
jgi:hypothetical protein